MIAAMQRMPAEVAFVVFTRTAFLAALVVLLAVATRISSPPTTW